MEFHLNANEVATISIAGKTLVYDTGNDAQVMWLEGSIALPVGSQIDLHSATAPHHGTATVTGIRLLAGSSTSAAQICLDVSVTEGWDKHYEAN
jgi:hypothetical protein